MKVAIGAAQGLVFLHDSEQPVIYRDFKASNVLVDLVCCLAISIHMIWWALGEITCMLFMCWSNFPLLIMKQR